MKPDDVIDLSDETIQSLNSAGHASTYEAGAVICHEGDVAGAAIFVRDGIIDIRRRVDGDEISVGSVSRNRLVGELAAVDGNARTASLVAKTRCEVVEIDQLALADLIETQPSVSRDLLRTVVARFRSPSNHLPVLSKDARSVARAAISVLDHCGAPWGLMTVAQLPAVTLRDEVCFEADRFESALDELTRTGLLACDGNRVAVSDRATLEKLSRGAPAST